MKAAIAALAADRARFTLTAYNGFEPTRVVSRSCTPVARARAGGGSSGPDRMAGVLQSDRSRAGRGGGPMTPSIRLSGMIQMTATVTTRAAEAHGTKNAHASAAT